jgi:adenylate cyclase
VGTSDGFEIERKYLLERAPSPELLASLGAVATRIEQVYLTRADGSDARRVRRLDGPDGTHFRYTEKRHVRGIVREEREREIDAATFERLLAEADPSRRPIRKTRHAFPYAGEVLEVDVFEGRLAGLVLLEIELEDEDATPEIPEALGPWRDVSEDVAYLNWSLAAR